MSSQSSGTSTGATWTKVTKTFTDFAAAALTNKIDIMALPKNTAVTAILIWVNTVFSDGGGNSTTIKKIGTDNTNDALIYTQDLLITQITTLNATGQYRPFVSSFGDGMSSLIGKLTGSELEFSGGIVSSLTVDDTINATLMAGVNLNTMISGSITFYIKTETLPS